MRTLQRNKTPLKYANLVTTEEVIEYDKHGDPVIVGEPDSYYSTPVDFKANIVMSGGEAEAVEFGLNLADYSAKIVVSKGYLPIKEGSLVWDKTEPQLDQEGHSIKSSADYIVVKISPTPNVDKIILQRLVNTNA